MGQGDTRFFPTKRTVYEYQLYASGGSVKASEDQEKIKKLLTKTDDDTTACGKLYYNFEAFDARLLSRSYGISLDKTFGELLLSEDYRPHESFLTESDTPTLPLLPDEYFANVPGHLRPGPNATAQQRYDIAVKLLIRDCAK